jgi:translation elongation factor EF-1alpha
MSINDSSLILNTKFVVVGHVDAGKSTLIGHLLEKMGYNKQGVSEYVEKIRNQQGKEKKNNQHFSCILDIYDEERGEGKSKGKTHEYSEISMLINTTTFRAISEEQADNSSNLLNLSLIDTPGHEEYIRSTISAISSDNVTNAIVVISMKPNEFAAGFENGMLKEHMKLLKSSGIKNIIFVANKMDEIGWNKTIMEESITKIAKFAIKELGFDKNNLKAIPIDAFNGHGLLNLDNCPEWTKLSIKDAILELAKKNSKKSSGDTENKIIGNKLLVDMKVYSKNIIITPHFKCVMHYNGKEVDATVLELPALNNTQYKFIRTSGNMNESYQIIFGFPKQIEISAGTNITFRINKTTIGYGIIIQ